MAAFLHAAGFHTLSFDVRGHGANPPEPLPLSAGEFGADTLAAFRALLERPDVTEAAISGHSMGAIGAILAGAADPRVTAIVATSGPADPYRLTRQTFRLAHLPIPDVIAYPLAWLTTRVYLRPRGHRVADISAARAIARYAGPVLLAHGEFDTVVPPSHMERLADAARAARADDPKAAPVETLVVKDGQHSWLYEDREYRGVVAGFLTRAFGGPLDPAEAAARAEASKVERIPDIESAFAAIKGTPGGLRTLASVALPGATRAPRVDPDPATSPPASGSIPAAPTIES
jgi:alpha-beta hydrolase superfamily lysophospholipase